MERTRNLSQLLPALEPSTATRVGRERPRDQAAGESLHLPPIHRSRPETQPVSRTVACDVHAHIIMAALSLIFSLSCGFRVKFRRKLTWRLNPKPVFHCDFPTNITIIIIINCLLLLLFICRLTNVHNCVCCKKTVKMCRYVRDENKWWHTQTLNILHYTVWESSLKLMCIRKVWAFSFLAAMSSTGRGFCAGFVWLLVRDRFSTS